jgi:hypothetical protein
MEKPNSAALTQALAQFTGTEYWHRHPLNRECLYTDGVEYFADKVGGYWLLDILATEYFELQHNAGFLSVRLDVKGNEADLIIEDGDYVLLAKKHIGFTDCPEGDWRFFFTDNVILLPSEY